MKVLVTDGYFRKSLAAVRGLAACGHRVVAGERVHLAPALCSRHAAVRLVYPDPDGEPEAFLRSIRRAIIQHDVDVLLPMEETTLLLILDNRERIPSSCALYAPPASVIRRLADKLDAARLLAAAGFPVPETGTDPTRAPLPAIVKPRRGSGACGVVRVEDRGDCITAFETIRRQHGDPVVQTYVPGHGVGVSLLIDRAGETVAAFAHRRIRERPVTGGASTQRESIPLPPDFRQLGRALSEAGFYGPVHVEFRRERDGTLRPIEINPRYWGSLALALTAGVNFPELHCRLARGERPEPVIRYPPGLRCRWLLPGDILAGIGLLRRGRLRAALATLDPRGPFDILSAVDPGPAVARIAAPAAWLASAGLRRLLARTTSADARPHRGT